MRAFTEGGLAVLPARGQAEAMITVETTNTDVRVTIPKDAVPPRQLNAFLHWLRLEEIAQHSRLTDKEADDLAEEAKASWWTSNKGKFIPSTESRAAGARL